ncbi:MAG: hypothetical protein KKD94_03380 [Nanoarchaeota archaeon]|nr:hypothetical protein [Nanoarchaeota archaeon]
MLKPGDMKSSLLDWKVVGVLNPGGTRFRNGKIVLYARVAEAPIHHRKNSEMCPVIVSEEEYKATTEKINRRKIERKNKSMIFLKDKICKLTNISHFRKVILDKSGLNVEYIDPLPTFVGCPSDSEYGVEDARITKIKNTYYMTYVAVSDRNGISTSLAKSKDLENWTQLGLIFQEQNKDAVLFPEKIKGIYVALNRPESSFAFSKPSIWISYSRDLLFWGKEKSLLSARKDSWESEKNGAGAPPIKTKHGWIVIYHGVRGRNKNRVYSAGAALLDLKNPEKVLARTPTSKPLLKPSTNCEKKGFINNVVFPTAAIYDLKNPKDLLIYSGGADSVITVRKLTLKEIFKNMERV